jgi:peptide maturation system acyl carrier-related protein
MAGTIETREKLVAILRDNFPVDQDSLPPGWQNHHFLGNTFRFAARDLLALLYHVEREFPIKVPENEIASGKFSTFENIIDIIKKESDRKNNSLNEKI